MKSNVFIKKARDYALYRPQYACEAIEALIDITGMDFTWSVADIGSGTGNVTRHLIDRVSRVFAVEPEAAMRYQAELLLGEYPFFKSIEATAEKTTLQHNSVNLITIGQAFHWIDWEKAQKEFDRILKTDGWIALIWNQYETTPDMDMDFLFKPDTQSRHSYPVVFEEGWSEFIGGIRSASRNPNPGDEEYEEFEEKLRKRFDSQSKDDRITVKYTTELAAGRLNR
jgi:ubiquinone/menaquinone biosynthesis C-methylase UbiE